MPAHQQDSAGKKGMSSMAAMMSPSNAAEILAKFSSEFDSETVKISISLLRQPER
jgi:hypothetical protein